MDFKELPAFARQADKLIGQDEVKAVKDFLTEDPHAGVVIPKSGGLRKLRWAASGRGKSGGARIIYFLRAANGTIYLCEIYAKAAQSDLTPKQAKNIQRRLP